MGYSGPRGLPEPISGPEVGGMPLPEPSSVIADVAPFDRLDAAELQRVAEALTPNHYDTG